MALCLKRIAHCVGNIIPEPSNDRLPKERGKSARNWCICFCVFLTGGGYFVSSSQNFILYVSTSFSVTFSVITISDFLIRFSEAWEELRHVNNRYDTYWDILKDALPQRNCYCIFCALVLLPLVYLHQHKNPVYIFYDFGICGILSSFMCSLILWKMLGIEQSGHLKESLTIESLHRLDYGSGMALSYFHGYLNIILPKVSDIQERIKKYESSHGVRFAVRKLFILIPLSLHCHASLANENNKRIKEAQSLEPKRLTRAGTIYREYKTSVYKIEDGEHMIYFCGEYATPMLTFSEVLRASGMEQMQYKKHKAQLVLHFYKTLKSVLENDPDCRGVCELIFYDDIQLKRHPSDKDKFIDVTHLILNAIVKCQNE